MRPRITGNGEEMMERKTCPICNLTASLTAWKYAGGLCPSSHNHIGLGKFPGILLAVSMASK
jgi:hypothetical protein